MARSDLLKQLFAAYARADDQAFRATAGQIVADERRLGHRLLAADLEYALSRDASPMTEAPLTMRPLPKGRDDRALLSLVKPAHELVDLVLTDDVRSTLAEVIEENRSRSLLAGYRLSPRRRLMFLGDPGTGKTASAHVIASELSLPVASVSLPALMSSYFGETAKNVEAIIHFAELTPCVLVFDEFEAVATDRGTRHDHGELRRVMATILQLIEEVHGESLIVATSNHPELLDRALWRRFDDVVHFPQLDREHVVELLQLKLRGVPHRLDLASWALELQGFAPADIEHVTLDAQRRWVLSGEPALTDAQMNLAVGRRHPAGQQHGQGFPADGPSRA